jgi:membrane-associated protein
MDMDVLNQSIDIALHLDEYMQLLAEAMGLWLYVFLFLIIFCETGLVATPLLPGDSLLFAIGAVAALPDSPISLPLLIVVLSAAAIGGDALNYFMGYLIGPKIFRAERFWLLNKKHLLRAQSFYERYGGKTIVLARFIPIIRTFAPFVAGIGKMQYRKFAIYNVLGGIVWVSGFIVAGYCFGVREEVKRNFHLVIAAIIVLSVLPAVVEFGLGFFRKKYPSEANLGPADASRLDAVAASNARVA